MAAKGGSRTGAGRKPKQAGQPRVSLSTRIAMQSAEQLKAYAAARGLPVGQAIDELLASAGIDERLSALPEAASAAPPLPDSFLRLLVEHMAGCVAFIDRDLRVRYVNENWCTFMAVSAAEVLGRPISDFLVDSPLEEAMLQRVLATGETLRAYGYGYLSSANELLYLDSSISVVRDAQQAIQGLLIFSIDVSERVRREQAASRRSADSDAQRSLFEMMIHQSPAGIVFVDRHAVVKWVNPAYQQQGQQDEIVLERNFFAQLSGEHRTPLEKMFQQVLETGRPFHVSGSPFHPVSTGRPRAVTLHPLTDKGGQTLGVLIFTQVGIEDGSASTER